MAAHQVITTLSLREDVDWGEVATRLEQLAGVVAEHAALESIRLVRLEPGGARLLIRYGSDEAMKRLQAEVIQPWLRKNLAEWWTDDPKTDSGEVVFSLTRADDDDVAAIEGLSGPERLAHFVDTVLAAGSLWGLYGKTWARSSAIEDTEALPFWPTMKLAARNCQDEWASYAPREIQLEPFLEQWLSGMQEDGIVAVIAPTPTHPGFTIDPAELVAALSADEH